MGAPDSPGPNITLGILYGNGAASVDKDAEVTSMSEDESHLPQYKAEDSMYLKLFEEMVQTVLKEETYLFDAEETAALRKLYALSVNARYIFVRLCLRKNDWFSLRDLQGYQSELGSRGLQAVVYELCGVRPPSSPETPNNIMSNSSGRETIDLTDEDETQDVDAVPEYVMFSHLAYRVTHAGLPTLLERLTVDQLKWLLKSLKCRQGGNRKDLVERILQEAAMASVQSTLPFDVLSKAGTIRAGQPRRVGVQKPMTQEQRIRELVIQLLKGDCIFIAREVYELVRRLDLIYFRHTSLQSHILTPAVLVRAKKRTYGLTNADGTCVQRTSGIWPDREAIIEYEKALQLEARIDSLDASEDTDGGFATPAMPDPRASTRSMSESVCVRGSRTPMRRGSTATTARGESVASASTRLETPRLPEDTVKAEPVDGEVPEVVPPPEDAAPQTKAAKRGQKVRDVIEGEGWYAKWQALVVVKSEQGTRGPGLGRFESGHVLTRLIHKYADALGRLGKEALELEVLDALLAQTRWQHRRRGTWHTRKAIIFMKKKNLKNDIIRAERAYETVNEALRDELTNLIFRPGLEKRLKTVEAALKLPASDRYASTDSDLTKAREITIHRIRVQPDESSVPEQAPEAVDIACRSASWLVNASAKAAAAAAQKETPRKSRGKGKGRASAKKSDGQHGRFGVKSVWRGRDGEEVSVEMVALQYYETEEGYKGFHSEGQIIRMLFGMFFWDIIFAPIPGAFETPYQSAPLDLTEDSFYIARKDLIESRLQELREGKAAEIVERIDSAHRESETWCVGVRWQLCSRQDLLEIVQCFSGNSLAAICQILCEDYAARASGVPDLFLWNPTRGHCKFAEVKGPGDRLSATQDLWIDSLIKAGVFVDRCNVVEGDPKAIIQSNPKPRSLKRPASEALHDNSTPPPDSQMTDLPTQDSDIAKISQTPPKRRRVDS